MAGRAQTLDISRSGIDTAYIDDLSDQFTLRALASNKFTRFRFGDYHTRARLQYRPNDRYNFGLGFAYKFLGLNLLLNLPFVNNDDDQYGKTASLDLQSSIYMRKLVMDLYAQFYKGYYISNPGDILANPLEDDRYPVRPDINTTTLGFNIQRVFNHNRFSYRAAYLQNEYQKKSSGSVIGAWGAYAILATADSSLIPAYIKNGFFENADFNKSNIYNTALSVGYAHTFVMKKHFFVTLSALGGAGVNYTRLRDAIANVNKDKLGSQVNMTARLAFGYNSREYYAGIQYVELFGRSSTPVPGTYQQFSIGNIRLTLAKRFKLKKELLPDITPP